MTTTTTTRYGARFGNENLSAVAIEAGQVYETETGVRVEVVEDDRRGKKPLVVSKSDRDGEERMSRYSFADMVNYEGMVLSEDADEDEDDEEDRHVSGEFVETPRCPGCGAFMRYGYDDMGLPTAGCPRESCEEEPFDDSELIDYGYYEL